MKTQTLNKCRKLLAGALLLTLAAASLTGCGTSEGENSSSETSGSAENGTVVLRGIADLTPHSELIEFVRDDLAAQGIEIDLVSTASDATTNEKTNAGEIDFNFFQHEPYLLDECSINGFDLKSAGAIHVEPITAYSDKYTSIDEIPDGATVAVPNNGTNEIRALNILQEQGFITLKDSVSGSMTASAADIEENPKDLQIIELESDQIIPTKDDYDFFIVNTNKALEANLTSNKLFSESGKNNPYANIIAVRSEDVDNPAIQALVAALKSDATKQFILENYDGAVIPVE